MSEPASQIEHSILRPDALAADVDRAAREAPRRFASALVVAPVWVPKIAPLARDSALRIGAVVSYPHGTAKATIKAIEASGAVKDGARIVEVCPHLAGLLAGDLESAKRELMEIVRACRATGREVEIRVVTNLVETSQDDAVELVLRSARESGCDGIVLRAPTVQLVARVRRLSQGLSLKALLTTPNDPMAAASVSALLDAGADRVGMEIA